MTHRVRFIAATILVLAIVPALAGDGPRRQGQPGGRTSRGTSSRPATSAALPLTPNSTDQLPLYSGLTPLRDDVSNADINELFLPENFKPIGETHEEIDTTGRGSA